MKNDAKKSVQSADIAQYKLPKALLGKFEEFEAMREYMSRAGRPAPNYVRLSRADAIDIDSRVRDQSQGKFSRATVFYRGLPVIAHDEQPPVFALESAA